MLYVIGLLAVGFSAITGALAAEGRRMDLFGVLVLALVTSLGGGTLRDLVLDVPVFWSTDDWFLWTGLAAGALAFAAVRYWHPPHQFLLIADAIGLAFVAVLGTEKALAHHATATTAIVLGVVTGVAGGILRDLLCGEVPLVFRRETYLYATAAFGGDLVFVLLHQAHVDRAICLVAAAGVILALRLAGLRWKLALPVFRTRGQDQEASE
jgi:uncharacterized membrane protein YeiH